MKVAAVLFAIFIVSIILLADMGYLQGELRSLHDLPFGDKLGHFFLIGTLSFLIISSIIQSFPSSNPKLIAFDAGFFLALIFSFEEASQMSVRWREASWSDLLANYAGIIFFGFLAWYLNGKRKP